MTSPAISELPLIGILRGFSETQLAHIIPAILRGGLTNLEITMNSPGAARQISEAIMISEGRLNIGAGTVTDLNLLRQALAAGASFIVTPTLNLPVVRACVEQNIPVFPGALSPTEIYRAWEAGATMVKVFPAEHGGPAFIRALKGPFPKLKLLPTGGVDLQTLPEFVQAGADGFGIGSPLFQRDKIDAADWPWLEQRARSFIEARHAALARASG
jgi:2-dehydro-3-deoxyphosphogluconate aldolase/(4S)-4-hydroxy-2-oxoglutarate aldolase